MRGALSAAVMAASVFLATAQSQEPDAGGGLVRVAPANGFDEQLWRARLLEPSPVSYTHLTLPTICSV